MQTTEAAAVKKSGITTRELVIDAMLIALTYIFTAFVNLRLPIAANGGLIHLGNVPLFLAAIIFGRRTGTLAGAFGMGLFDLLSGWYLWAPFTFVIVGFMGFTVGAITEKHHGYGWNALAIAVACVIKVVGYYIAEGFKMCIRDRLCRLFDDIGEHEENHVQAAFPVRHRQVGNQLLADLLQFCLLYTSRADRQ